jgi:hypothetical protein
LPRLKGQIILLWHEARPRVTRDASAPVSPKPWTRRDVPRSRLFDADELAELEREERDG